MSERTQTGRKRKSNAERARTWRQNHKERSVAMVRASQKRHPDTYNAWQRNNPEKARQASQKKYQKHCQRYTDKRYKLVEGQWHQMFEEQHGCCAICGKHQSELSHTLNVDHCHITGEVRGLLCGTCNRMLGYYEKYRRETECYLGKETKEHKQGDTVEYLTS